MLTPLFLGMFQCFPYCNTNSTTKHEKHKKDWTSKQQQGYMALDENPIWRTHGNHGLAKLTQTSDTCLATKLSKQRLNIELHTKLVD